MTTRSSFSTDAGGRKEEGIDHFLLRRCTLRGQRKEGVGYMYPHMDLHIFVCPRGMGSDCTFLPHAEEEES